MGVPRIPDWDTLQATDMNPKTGERNVKMHFFVQRIIEQGF